MQRKKEKKRRSQNKGKLRIRLIYHACHYSQRQGVYRFSATQLFGTLFDKLCVPFLVIPVFNLFSERPVSHMGQLPIIDFHSPFSDINACVTCPGVFSCSNRDGRRNLLEKPCIDNSWQHVIDKLQTAVYVSIRTGHKLCIRRLCDGMFWEMEHDFWVS